MEIKIGLIYLAKFVFVAIKEKKFDFFYLLLAILHVYPEAYQAVTITIDQMAHLTWLIS